MLKDYIVRGSFSYRALCCLLVLGVSCGKRVDQKPSTNTKPDKYDNYVDWAIYRGDKKSNQYSELAQINAANVHKLKPVWEYHTGDPNGPSMYSNPNHHRRPYVLYNASVGRSGN